MKLYRLEHEVAIDDLKKFNFENQKLGVIVYIEDNSGNILLQQRGAKSRDENFLFEQVGGSLEKDDADLKSAIIREIKEEMGDNAKFEIEDSKDIYHVYKNNTNWVFAIFKGKYIEGKIDIIEPEKCLEYKFFSYNEAIKSDAVSEGCKFLIKSINKR